MGINGFDELRRLLEAERLMIEGEPSRRDYEAVAKLFFSLARSLVENTSPLDDKVRRDATELCKRAEVAYQMAISQKPALQHYWIPEKLLPHYKKGLKEIERFREKYNL